MRMSHIMILKFCRLSWVVCTVPCWSSCASHRDMNNLNINTNMENNNSITDGGGGRLWTKMGAGEGGILNFVSLVLVDQQHLVV
jgi:hypothetical protein